MESDNKTDTLAQKIYKKLQEQMKRCRNDSYVCRMPCLKDSNYCSLHILKDHNNDSYRQCGFLYNRRKRCTNVIYTGKNSSLGQDSGVLCPEHDTSKIKELSGPPITTKEAMWNDLAVVLAKETKDVNHEKESEIDVESTDDKDVFQRWKSVKSLEEIKADSEKLKKDPVLVSAEPDDEKVVNFNEEQNDDSGSSGSNSGDELDRCCYYTQEQIVYMNLVKHKKMRNMYQTELMYLKKESEQARLRYLIDGAAEANMTPKEFVEKNQTKPNWKYPLMFNGAHNEKWCVQQAIDKHQKNTKFHKATKVRDTQKRCTFKDGGVMCTNMAIVYTKYCVRHILNDKRQQLYVACKGKTNGKACTEPVLIIEKYKLCCFHMTMQNLK